jgi:small subunit ribosomal protein S7
MGESRAEVCTERRNRRNNFGTSDKGHGARVDRDKRQGTRCKESDDDVTIRAPSLVPRVPTVQPVPRAPCRLPLATMRGKKAPKRAVMADAKYHDLAIAKLITTIMKGGKRSTAERVVYGAFDLVEKKTEKNPVDVFTLAMKNLSPTMEVRSRRVGGANYQIPYPVRTERRQTLSLRWLTGAARGKKGKTMAIKLAEEIIDASNREGGAMKKKIDVHRMAESNRAFAHFAR